VVSTFDKYKTNAKIYLLEVSEQRGIGKRGKNGGEK
jgi:hypothetical protein